MGDESERRRGERVFVNQEFSDPDSRTPTYVSDLSEHGVFVHTRQKVPLGTTIELRFTVLLDEPIVIQGLGKVVRHQSAPVGVGVEFGPMSPEMVLRIHDVLARQRPRASGEPVSSPPQTPLDDQVTRTFDLTQLPTREFKARSITESEFEEAKTGSFEAVRVDALPVDDDDEDGAAAATSDAEYEELGDAELEEVDEEDIKTRAHTPIQADIVDDD
jgi:Tfp pilus assembly protein PilZ